MLGPHSLVAVEPGLGTGLETLSASVISQTCWSAESLFVV